MSILLSLHVEKSIVMTGVELNPVAIEIEATIIGLAQEEMCLESTDLKVSLITDLDKLEQVIH